jgi:hypothetical protein
MRTDYKKLKKNIPGKVKAGPRAEYEVLWGDGFPADTESEKTFGLTRFQPKQIVIYKEQGDKEAVHTFFHELLHAISHEYDVNLTENQVRALERAFNRIREVVLVLDGKKIK